MSDVYGESGIASISHSTAPTLNPEDRNIEPKADVSKSSPLDGLLESSLMSADPNNNNNIEYVYLDWNTEVATRPIFPDGLLKDYPAMPDLRKHDNPFGWSRTRKNFMTCVSCATNGVSAYASGAYAAPEKQLTELWHISDIKFSIGITLFVAGFGIAPMIVAPFSEINGRRPVFIASTLVFVICQLCCALTQSYGGMLAARFFAGVGGSTSSAMVGGILADIWIASERNTPMVIFAGATLVGTGFGPLCSGFIAQNLLWRWVFYVQVISSSFLLALIGIFFKETRGPVLLFRRAQALNRWYEAVEKCGALGMENPEEHTTPRVSEKLPGVQHVTRIRYKVLAEEQRVSLLKMISISLYRPTHLLLTEPVVICFSLWISLAWATLYLQFSAIPLVYGTNHNFSIQESGAVFTSVSVGGIISSFLSIYQDKWAVKKFGTKFTKNPEGRLWFTCPEGLLMPIGMLWFGWTCYSSIHWVVPTIALVAVTMGIFSIFLATFNYMADVYLIYASSALAAAGVSRNLIAAAFPPITKQMFTGMGFQGASSLLGGIGFLLSLGPILLIFYGPKIRARSKIAKQFLESGNR